MRPRRTVSTTRGVLVLVGVATAGAAGDAELGGRARRVDDDRLGPAGAHGAAPERRRGLDRLAHRLRGAGRREGPEVEVAVGLDRSDQREPREPLVQRELHVGRRAPALPLTVEAGLELLDEPELAHRCLELVRALDPVDGLRLAEQLGHLPTVVAAEVRAHACPEVRRLADVEDATGAVLHQIDAGSARQPRGEAQLARRRVGADGRERQQIVESEHAEGAGPLEQRVQDLGGGRRVGERAVARRHRHAEVPGEGSELEVGHLVAHQSAREPDRVDATLGQLGVAVRGQGGIEERDVEPDVVTDDDRPADELEQGRQDLVDARRGQQHGLGDAGQHGDERRDGDPGVHERLEPSEQLTPAVLHRADLGDRAVVRRRPRRLEVDHHERHLGQGRPEVVEAGLPRGAHGGPP